MIYHISDIHIRNNPKRFEEYNKVIDNLCKTIKEEKYKEKTIVITGDTFHEKCILSPEAITQFENLIIKLSEIGEIIIIDGNHDININNSERMSSIKVSITNLKTENKIYYLDKENKNIKLDNIKYTLTPMEEEVTKIEKEEGIINIGLYHGTLYKSKLDNNYELTDENKIKASDFEDYDIVMLGDIHKHQYMNEKRTIAYASSLLQNNIGESVEKHGVIRWNPKTKKGKFIEIYNEECFIKGILTEEGLKLMCEDENILNEKKKLKLELHYEKVMKGEIIKEIKKLKKKYEVNILRTIEIEEEKIEEKYNKIKSIAMAYKEIVKKENMEIDNVVISKLEEYENDNITNKELKLISLEFNNLFSYDINNKIDFEKINGILTISGLNGSGKTSIIDVILYSIYDEFSKGKGKEALNINKTRGGSILIFMVNGETYKIERHITKTSSILYLYKKIKNNEYINITETKKKDTEATIQKLTGSYNILKSICITLQEGTNILNNTDEQKMNIFCDLLNINKYKELHKNSLTELRSLNRSIPSLEKEINIKEEQLIIKKIIEENINKITEDIKNQTIELHDFLKDKYKIEFIINEINTTYNEKDVNSKLKEEINELNNNKAKLKNTEILKNIIKNLEDNILIITTKIKTLNNPNINIDTEKQILKNNNEKITILKEKIYNIQKEKYILIDINENDDIIKKITESINLIKNKIEEKNIQNKIKINDIIIELNNYSNKNNDIIKEKENEIEKINNTNNNLDGELILLKEKIKTINENIKEYNDEIILLKQDIKKQKLKLKTLDDKKELTLQKEKIEINEIDDEIKNILIDDEKKINKKLKLMLKKEESYNNDIYELKNNNKNILNKIKKIDLNNNYYEILKSCKYNLKCKECLNNKTILNIEEKINIDIENEKMNSNIITIEENIEKINNMKKEHDEYLINNKNNIEKIKQLNEKKQYIINFNKEKIELLNEKIININDENEKYEIKIEMLNKKNELNIESLNDEKIKIKNKDIEIKKENEKLINKIKLEIENIKKENLNDKKNNSEKIEKMNEEEETMIYEMNENIKEKIQLKNEYIKKIKLENKIINKEGEEVFINKIKNNIEKINNEIININEINENIKIKIKIQENYLIENENNEELKNKISKNKNEIEKTNYIIEEQYIINKNITQIENNILLLNKNIENIDIKIQQNIKLDLINKIIVQKNIKILELNNELTKDNQKVGGLNEILKIIKIEKERMTLLKNSLIQQTKITDLFEKYGIMNYMISGYIEQLEISINNILSSIVDYKIKIEYEENELKINKIEIIENKEYLINTLQLSGNEKFIINLALKSGLNKIGISYKSKFLIIDEGFGTCDIEKLDKINELFEKIQKEFELCIIISHMEKIQNINNKNIKIIKKNGISEILKMSN